MMILKEGFGWSDGKLFEECNFNILVMKALGLEPVMHFEEAIDYRVGQAVLHSTQ